ncbi:MAG: hypothetical protein ACT4TC_23185 [Myxococcaceae bacterium]
MAERGLIPSIDRALAYVRDVSPLDAEEMNRRLAEIRSVASKTQAELDEAEREVRNLSNLYVMHVRLFAELTPRSVSDAVQEIIINFLGSEDFAFYVSTPKGFVPTAGMGPALQSATVFHQEADTPLASALTSDKPAYGIPGAVVATSFPETSGKPVGLLEVKTLMRHKRWLNNRDRELISILRTQGGMALGLALEREARAG